MDRMLSNEALLSAKAAAKKASESAQYAINLIDVREPEQAATAIECGTAKAIEAVNHFSKALTIAYEHQILAKQAHGNNFSPNADEAVKFGNAKTTVLFKPDGTVQCTFHTPPFTKSRATQNRFFEYFCMDLQQKVVSNYPPNYKKIETAYVIFIHHYDGTDPHKQPYFDNDNLAIKAILDSVLPYVCYDDASCYCSNLYLSQPDVSDFSELIILEKCNAKRWICERNELDFSKDFA